MIKIVKQDEPEAW